MPGELGGFQANRTWLGYPLVQLPRTSQSTASMAGCSPDPWTSAKRGQVSTPRASAGSTCASWLWRPAGHSRESLARDGACVLSKSVGAEDDHQRVGGEVRNAADPRAQPRPPHSAMSGNRAHPGGEDRDRCEPVAVRLRGAAAIRSALPGFSSCNTEDVANSDPPGRLARRGLAPSNPRQYGRVILSRLRPSGSGSAGRPLEKHRSR